jgi:pimeloyl-ACP methyl ester carboxylesterase
LPRAVRFDNQANKKRIGPGAVHSSFDAAADPSQSRCQAFPILLHRTIFQLCIWSDCMNLIHRSRTARTPIMGALAVVALGAAALINVALARRAERQNPPRGKFVEVDGLWLHYIEKGIGSPVVLLHGNQALADDFEISGVIGLIAKSHRVLAFDRPGFGHSERSRDKIWTASAQAALIRKALIKLGVEKPILVGHSWGTLVALALGIEHPDEASALLLLSGYYFPSKRLDVAVASLPAVPILGDILSYTISPLVGWLAGPMLLKIIFAPKKVAGRFKRKFPFSMALRPSQIKATAGDAALMVPATDYLQRRYRDLLMPVAIMAGRGDKIVSVEPQALRLHRLVRQSTLEVMEGTGHMIHYASPGKVASRIDELWAETQRGTSRATQ